MGDLISREEAISRINSINCFNDWDDKEDIVEQAVGIVLHLPAVDPVRRGRWINAFISGVHHFRCSECAEYVEATSMGNYSYRYCPNCGAKMDASGETMEQDEHVYCTMCRNFEIRDELVGCPYEAECNLWDCEDSKPFSERPHYEPVEVGFYEVKNEKY